MSQQVKKAVCMWCHNHCGVFIHVTDGRLDKIEDAQGHPHGNILSRVVRACARARAAPEWFYHPDRLNYPLKRAAGRGEGKWQTITWDQAFDEIAGKLKSLKRKYGAETLASASGTYRTQDEYRARFMNLFGSPNHIGQGHICFGPANMVGAALYGWPVNYTWVRPESKCIILSGVNPDQSNRALWYSVLDAKNNGAKLIVIDPRRTATAERADLWLQLRPGTDTALYMGMINTIISEKLYDKEFVDRWCYGFDQLAERAREYPLNKVAEITWVPEEKIRQAARMFATNKPAIFLVMMGVEQLPNCIEALHAQHVIPALTGNIDIKGGFMLRPPNPNFVSDYDIELNEKLPPEQIAKSIGMDRFRFQSREGFDLVMENVEKTWGKRFAKSHNCFAHNPSVYRAMLSGQPYPVRAFIGMASNPMVTQSNTRMVYKALTGLDLSVVMDFWLTPTAELADYVLPAASWLERPNVNNQNDMSSYLECGVAAFPHSVPGKYDRRRDFDLWRELGLRLGQKRYWPWQSLEESYDDRLKSSGHTIAEMANINGGYHSLRIEERKYLKVGFGTPTGKIELASNIFEKLGYDPLPRYEEPAESPLSNAGFVKEYPLVLITGGRFLPMYHSEHRQIDALRRQHPNPLVQINPETAKRLGIEDGDWVWVETPRGKIRQKCLYFNGIDPRVVHCEHGWWFPELPGEEPWLHGVWESNVDVLTADDDAHCNKLSGGWPLRTLMCQVSKAKKY